MTESLDNAKDYISTKIKSQQRWRKKGRQTLKTLYKQMKEKYKKKEEQRENAITIAREQVFKNITKKVNVNEPRYDFTNTDEEKHQLRSGNLSELQLQKKKSVKFLD